MVAQLNTSWALIYFAKTVISSTPTQRKNGQQQFPALVARKQSRPMLSDLGTGNFSIAYLGIEGEGVGLKGAVVVDI
jgi:hypothetical protein